jgi:hypothetical protein
MTRVDAEIGYERTAVGDWVPRVQELYQSGQLCIAPFSTDGVVSVQVWGTCPRCLHNSLDVQRTLTALVPVTRGGWSSIGRKDAEIPASVEVDCDCGLSHDGAPQHVTGCGATFSLPTAPPAP